MIIENVEQKKLIDVSIMLKKARIIANGLESSKKDKIIGDIISLEMEIHSEVEKINYTR